MDLTYHLIQSDVKTRPLVSSVPEVEIIRIDFERLRNGKVIINKMGKGLKGNLFVDNSKTVENFDLAGALNWCRSNGWTVRQWPTGARAWKHGLEPVRSKYEILKLRDQLREHPRPELEGAGYTLDLAYDL